MVASYVMPTSNAQNSRYNCLRMFVHVCGTHMCVCTCVLECTRARMCMGMRVWTCVHACVCAHAHACVFVCVYIHVGVCACLHNCNVSICL